MWEEFPGIAGMGTKHLDGRVMIDHYESTFPNGQQVKGLNIRTFDDERNTWSLVWLDNRTPADFTPLVGAFAQGGGTFYQVLSPPDGRPFHVRYITYTTVPLRQPIGSKPSPLMRVSLGKLIGRWILPDKLNQYVERYEERRWRIEKVASFIRQPGGRSQYV